MKFICAQADLNTNLSLVSRAVPSRPTHPILSNIKLEADINDQVVRLTGFDLSLGIQSSFPAIVEDGGELTLPAKLLNDIIAKLPNDQITLDDNAGEAVVTITSAFGKYQVRGVSSAEFPELPVIENDDVKQLPANAFIDGLKGSLVAVSNDDTKQILTGVHLSVKPESLEFAATDGHRLGVVEIIPDEGDEVKENITEFEVTVPAKALRELEKMVSSRNQTSGESLALHLEQGQVVFEWGNQRLTTRTLDGKYPDYNLLIPKQFQRQVTVDRKRLLSALERIAVFADQRNNLVKFSISGDNQQVSLSVEAQELGNGQETIPAQISGEDLDVAFNVRYLMDGLKTIATTEITLHLNGAIEPVILTPLGGVKITYLVMPVQLRN